MSADTSSSTSAFVTTLIFNSVLGAVFLIGFLTLRDRFKRVYEPRTLHDIATLSDECRAAPVPPGYFAWLPHILSKPRTFIMQHAGLDGYFYIRYLAIAAACSVLTAAVLFPILLPVNITNGYGLSGFEIMSFANVKNKNRFYAHVFCSWIVFGLVLYLMYRELYHYVLVRHAALTTPLYDGLLSSRTVIVTELGQELANEGEFERLYPKCHWVNYAYDLRELDEKVVERQKEARRLEGALNGALRKAVKRERSSKENLPGSAAMLDTYVAHGKQPTHRLGSWWKPPMEKWFGRKKVHSIEYCEERIATLNEEIAPLQKKWENNDKHPSVFLQFATQLEAQECYQSLEAVVGASRFGKKFIGATPNDINWPNMSLTKRERQIKRLLANLALTLLIVFWAIPVAVVGCISNVNFLTEKLHFLRFINNLPNFLMGLITGILPTVALAVLMSLVAPVTATVGSISGCITVEETSLYVQKWYYAFQVVHVFIVVTLASSASATVEAIIRDPSSAMTLLAANLPKASNFYIVYFLLLGLTTPSGNLLQIVTLILSKVLRLLDSSPRDKWTRYNTLAAPNYGVMYPAIQVMAVIMLSYSVISPIILIFTSFAFATLYIANLYNLVYVSGMPKNDLLGKNYPFAIFQLFVGLYLAEVCLLGLFSMAKAWGPLVLECVFLAATAAFNIYLKYKFLPVLDILPLSAIRYAQGNRYAHYPYRDEGLYETEALAAKLKEQHESDITGGTIRPATRPELQRADLIPSQSSLSDSDTPLHKDEKQVHMARVASGATDTSKHASTFVADDEEFKKLHYSDIDPALIGNKDSGAAGTRMKRLESLGTVVEGDVGDTFVDPEALKQGAGEGRDASVLSETSVWQRIALFFKPWECYKFADVRMRLPPVMNNTIQYDLEYLKKAYTDDAVHDEEPVVWIAKDPMGVSEQLVKDARTAGVDVRDEGTGFDEKGRCTFSDNPPDYTPATKL